MITTETCVKGFSSGTVMKTALLSFFLLFAFSLTSSYAQNKNKEYLVTVTTMDNKQVRGTLVAANEKGVSVSGKGGETQLIEPSRVKTIKLRPRKNAATGLLIGAGIGLVGGGVLSAVVKPDDATETILAVVGTAGATFIGAAIGGSAGSKAKHVFNIHGRNEDYSQNLSAINAFVR